jgi:hypothetical protein
MNIQLNHLKVLLGKNIIKVAIQSEWTLLKIAFLYV